MTSNVQVLPGEPLGASVLPVHGSFDRTNRGSPPFTLSVFDAPVPLFVTVKVCVALATRPKSKK